MLIEFFPLLKEKLKNHIHFFAIEGGQDNDMIIFYFATFLQKRNTKSSAQIGVFFYPMFANWARAKNNVDSREKFLPRLPRMPEKPKTPKNQTSQKNQKRIQKRQKSQRSQKKNPETPKKANEAKKPNK